MDNPPVSVIIPVYKNERFIAEAVDSVLAQTYRPIEIIVVDDGSDDNTAEIVNSYTDITYIFQENQGHGKAKNTGIQAARGAFFSFFRF